MNERETGKRSLAADPVLLLFLGACPALGAAADVRGALGMACAVMIVLVLSSLILGLLRRLIPAPARLPAAVLVSAGLASAVQLLMNAFLPSVFHMLGLYLAVIAVDLLVFGVAEESMERGLGRGPLASLLCALCFAAAVLVLAAVREVFGSASFAGRAIPALESYRIPLLTQASGGLLVFSFLLAVINAIRPGRATMPGGLTAAAVGLGSRDLTEGE